MTVTFRKATAADLDAVSAISRPHPYRRGSWPHHHRLGARYLPNPRHRRSCARPRRSFRWRSRTAPSSAPPSSTICRATNTLTRRGRSQPTTTTCLSCTPSSSIPPPKVTASAPLLLSSTSAPLARKAAPPCASIPMRATFLHAPSIINSATAKSPLCPASSTASTDVELVLLEKAVE